nr:MAG TPA: hypothetical protein [Caudoviricetes sp.]
MPFLLSRFFVIIFLLYSIFRDCQHILLNFRD